MKEDVETMLPDLLPHFPHPGTVAWIGLRPAKRAPLTVVPEVLADPALGLWGDHYAGQSGKRHLSLIDHAHLAAIGEHLGRPPVDPGLLRRNLVIRGLNLLALKGRRFRVGAALLEYTCLCHPCSRMEANLGPGGWNAMRGHGGIHARILEGGVIRLGDAVVVVEGAASERDD